MDKWEEKTCVVFKSGDSLDKGRLGHTSYVYVRSKEGACNANIGRDPNGGPSFITASQSCQTQVSQQLSIDGYQQPIVIQSDHVNELSRQIT